MTPFLNHWLRIPAKTLWIILAIAIGVRLLQATHPVETTVDSTLYLRSATALLEGQWQRFYVERTPGYPLFIALHQLILPWFQTTMTLEGLQQALFFTQSIMGCFTAILAADISCRLFNRNNTALWTGILTAIAPNLLYYEHLILTESLYALSLVVCVHLFVRHASPGHSQTSHTASLFLALSNGWLVWIRAIGIVAPAVAGLLFLRHRNNTALKILGAVLVLFIGSWTLFNIRVHNYWGYTASSGINQLYKMVDHIEWDSPLAWDYKALIRQRLANFPPKRTYEAVNDAHIIRWLQQKEQRSDDEIYLEDDRISGRIAQEAIQAHPLLYIGATVKEFWRMTTTPTEWDPELFWWMPVFILSLFGTVLVTFNNRAALPSARWVSAMLWAHFLLYPILTICEPRYRVPLEPLLLVFAVYALSELITAHQYRNRPLPSHWMQPVSPV